MATLVSVDGVIQRPEEARISVFDRGFLYGDSVYEVMRVYRGIPFALEAHLERLESSAARIGLALPWSREALTAELRAAIAAFGKNPDLYLRVVVTRGSGRIGLDPGLAEGPRRIVIVQDVAETAPPARAYQDGVALALVGVRRNLREAIDPEAKTGNYLNSVLAVAEAKRQGAYEALMLDHRGMLTEGSSSNVFVVIGGLLMTPPLDGAILRGVTRGVVIDAAKTRGIRVLEVPLSESSLLEIDEAFITSSVREVVPAVKIGDRVLGDGTPGPVTRQVMAGFREAVDRYVAARG
jgi:branched-chain amino acid aminotransferase